MGNKKENKKVKNMKLNQSELDASKTMGKREEPDLQSDEFSPEEHKEIFKIVFDDTEVGYNAQAEWLEIKKKELEHIHAEAPSRIENLTKRTWMSDRNLGLLPGILDIFQATLLATCYNPDSLHFVATESNDIDNRDNLSKFAKWGLSDAEADFFPECDDFIANKVAHGLSFLKVYWEVEYQWVDKRIPVYSKQEGQDKVVIAYDIKTEKRRFERGVIKSIDNTDDILMPAYGKDIQKLPFFIEVVHYTFNDLEEMDEMGMLENFDKNEFLAAFKNNIGNMGKDDLRNKKLSLMKLNEVSNDRLSNTILDLWLWHGMYTKNGKREKYQFLVEPISEKVVFGKPVRKLNRSGRLPYVGGPLRKRPGMVRGDSLTLLIAPLINALNNNYNQTSDFQYVENMPFGFANLAELEGRKGVFELEPGALYNVESEKIQDHLYFPNLTRSMAWSYQDKDFLLEMIERLTGAATYFLTSDSKDATATRDIKVDEKSETKFGLWVKRIMREISEAVNMWIELYQDNAPTELGQRVLGEEGEKLFTHGLSIDDLRGRYAPQMKPDITHGSKSYEQRIALWGLDNLQKNSVWFHPQVNPRGNWKITADAMKKMGYPDYEDYLPEQPKSPLGASKEVEAEFLKLKQGDILNPPPEGVTPLVLEHYAGHKKQKEEKYNEIPEEYRPNFDAHIFATFVNMMEFIKNKQQQQMVDQVSQGAVQRIQDVAGQEERPNEQPNPAPNPLVTPTQGGDIPL